MNKAGFWLLAILLAGSLALAIPSKNPAIQQSVGSNELVVTFPEQQIFRYGSNVELYFHVHNSTGYWLNSSQANCTVHLYNHTNNQHLFQGLATTHAPGDYEYVLNMSVLEKGKYGYIVECSGLGEYGYVAGMFFLTTTGEDFLNDAWIVPILLCFIPLFFGWLLLRFVTELGDDHAEFKIGISILSLLMVLLSTWFGVLAVNKFFEWQGLQDALAWSAYVYVFTIVIVLVYFIIYLIIMAFRTAASQKVERLRY